MLRHFTVFLLKLFWTDANQDILGENRWRWDNGTNFQYGYVQKRESDNTSSGLLSFVPGTDEENCVEYVRNGGNQYGKLGKRPCANDCPIICKM